MKTLRMTVILPGTLVLGLTLAVAQSIAPGLPYEDPTAPTTRELFGMNSFGGNAVVVPDIHTEQLPLPRLDEYELTLTPFPRRYLVIRFYAVRPWFIHPYTGQELKPTDIIRSIHSDNPDWLQLARGRSLEELLQPDPETGEAMVEILDGGVVDESNSAEAEAFAAETEVEMANAAALGVELGNPARGILHSPFYGLYCIKIRICIPYLSPYPGPVVHRYWVRWAYPFHQGWCWRTWWWYRWTPLPSGQWAIWPYRPLCVPHAFWTRMGPDWVWHVTNPNRFRHWCLFGFRYYFTRFHISGFPPQLTPLPLIGELGLHLTPNPDLTTGWQHIWPYPIVRYWPYGPYCTRWYWFRCLPWHWYRYLPPVVTAAVAIPKPEFGAGFLPPGDDDLVFPLDPPRIATDGTFEPGAGIDSFFDIVGASTVRPLVRPLGDSSGNGLTSISDFPRPIREEVAHPLPIDLQDADLPAVQ